MTSSRLPTSCVIHAPAKLNLCLDLLGKRPDGFHELRTVMTVVGLFDTLRVIEDANGSAVTLELDPSSPQGRGVPIDGSNLIVRAIDALRDESGIDRGATVRLTKRIPSQAGLGGGSSDAAAALIGANRVWGLDWTLDRLATIAARLGSDIPFFVHALGDRGAQMALATGRGERIRPVAGATAGWPVVIVKPTEGLSTAKVFAECRPEDYQPIADSRCDAVARAIRTGDLRTLAGGVGNGLQAAATRVAPWLRNMAERFEAAGCAVHQLSGSGSAYFGVTRTIREARRLAARLRALRVGRVYATTFG